MYAEGDAKFADYERYSNSIGICCLAEKSPWIKKVIEQRLQSLVIHKQFSCSTGGFLFVL